MVNENINKSGQNQILTIYTKSRTESVFFYIDYSLNNFK